ncbi:oxidoreductase [Actinomadura craniellae]|uniref:Oxidoreductase n=1 Tax=Actinomadura craniellae TaxID=2231787 RepID=A0A365H661_9ACTN|nr:zinc-binding dehydrogenase [Actinomadura craniellae]RAY14585.1 oxidoreductase [Actinomadura craniellae]
MHAIRQYEFGPAENLRYEKVEDPAPGPGQVRIEVRAAGIHLLDTFIRAGEQGGPFPRPDLPMTPGREVAGVVDAVGDGVSGDWLGRRVVAHLGAASGGYAELAVANESALHALPDGLAEDAAVAMIGTGRTTAAIMALSRIEPSDVVLVTAAAGGIGSLAVQESRAIGATVVGLAGGAAKVEAVRALGADVAVDYTQAGWPEAVRDALGDRTPTVALDGVGGAAGHAAMKLLGPGGRLMIFGWSSGEATEVTTADLLAGGLTASVIVGPQILKLLGGLRPLEERALAAAAEGRWIPQVASRFPLAEAAAAHLALENRATTGKVILIP